VQRTKTDFGDQSLIQVYKGGTFSFFAFDNTTNLQTKYFSFTLTGSSFKITLRPFGWFDARVLTFTAYTDFDDIIAVNLTEMGQLPPPLKEYFNNVPSTWADLATGSNITAIDGKVQSGNAWLNDLLPYVNGVGTLGYAWGV